MNRRTFSRLAALIALSAPGASLPAAEPPVAASTTQLAMTSSTPAAQVIADGRPHASHQRRMTDSMAAEKQRASHARALRHLREILPTNLRMGP